MNRKISSQKLRGWLPAYLNHTLPEGDRAAVEAALLQSAEAQADLNQWRQVRTAATGQPWQTPSPIVRQKIMVQARSIPQLRRSPQWLPWIGGLVLTIAVTIVLWAIVQPGIGLQWSVSSDGLTAFRVYRAPAGSDRFTVVDEIPARPNTQDYAFVDTVLWPGQTYVYRIEGVSSQQSAVSQSITVNGLEALPAQLAILLTSLIIGYAAMYVMQQAPFGSQHTRRMA